MGNVNAVRLRAVLSKLAPVALAQHDKDGSWPNRHPEPGQLRNAVTGELILVNGQPVAAKHSGAPFAYTPELGKNAVRLRVTSDDGDEITAVGQTNGEALANLYLKIGLSDEVAT
jgi:hypothetical protein